MKRTEKLLNERFLAENLSPTPLLTRIGINTGDMVVGNMGTERKMDYTIMGNAVNLAARLEGVNKQYGSWILATEATKAETGATFAWRRLDRVRVVGINQPLRLYELVELAADLPAETTGLLADFDAALDLFEERRWTDASKAFQAIAERHPADGPCKTYLRRSREFQEKPPAHDWDGVFNLTEK
jgi:adenylate cyclase